MVEMRDYFINKFKHRKTAPRPRRSVIRLVVRGLLSFPTLFITVAFAMPTFEKRDKDAEPEGLTQCDGFHLEDFYHRVVPDILEQEDSGNIHHDREYEGCYTQPYHFEFSD